MSLLVALPPTPAYGQTNRQVAAASSSTAKKQTLNRVDALSVEEHADGATVLRLGGTAQPTFNVYRLADPDRLVIDLSTSVRGKVVPRLPLDTWAAGNLVVDEVEEAGNRFVRIVVQLKRDVSYIVVPDRQKLVVTLTPREVPPEAYFARKSAQERRNELETAKLALDVQRAEAKALKDNAAMQAAAARVRADEAEASARRAQAVEAHAKKTEARAKQAEAAAIAVLSAAKSDRAAAKDALLRAQQERAAAETERRRAAEQAAEALRVARSEQDNAKAAVERAQQAEKQAQALLADAQNKAARTDEAAEQRLAQAQRELDRARLESAAAQRTAKAIVEAAQARAQAKVAQAERAANERSNELEAAAKQRLEAAEAEASKVMGKARQEAQTLVAQRLAEAEAEAAKKIATAEAGAKAEVARRLASVEAKAERKLADAKSSSRKRAIARAERDLAKIRTQMQQETAAAVAAARTEARAQAEARLAQVRKDVEAQAERRLQAALAQAAKREAEAAAHMQAARADLETASAQRAEAMKLSQSLEERRAELAKVGEQLAKTRAQMQAEAKARDQELARAQTKAVALEQEKLALEREVARLRTRAQRRAEAASTAQQRVAQLEREGARNRELERAQADLAKAQAAASQSRSAFEETQKRLGQADTQLEQRQQEIARLRREHDALAHERKALSARNDEVRAQLAEAERKLAKVEQAVASKQRQLKAVEAKASKAEAPKAKTAAVRVKDVQFESDSDEERVIIRVDGPIAYEGLELGPNLRMLRVQDAKIDKALERSLDTSAYSGSIERITSFSDGADTKVIVAANTAVEPRVEKKRDGLVWHFPRSRKPVEQPEAVSLPGSKVSGFASMVQPEAAFMAPPIARPSAEPAPASSGRSKWRGERIDIELQEAPIKDVLLLFSDIGRVNIVAGKGVTGTITMKLQGVPWDQALDIILRSLELGAVREGNVIRVATLGDLEAERRQAIEQANARVQLKPLETRLVPVSYATVAEMVPKAQSVLSPRGTVTPDTRTNTLIIMDVAENIALAEQLIRSLDTQTPQVLIEARIVEARTNFTRQLGIQWGFDYIASPATGNPTGLLFPNSLGLGGGATGTPADTRGVLLPGSAASPNYAVDLPAPVGTGAGGALGFSFGSISGNLNTNLRLSAAEVTGEVRIISAPKIVTLDNSQAQIEQGVQIPISQVSAQGVNTRFVNATLSLRVTPHVTNEGAILLDVTVQKNEADFINTGARGDPTILTKQAQSRMLVNDNDTAVIGGIYTRNAAVNYAKVPWMADIPIVGWFFKNKSEADTRSEVLIFLTPKIVNRASSIGG